MAGKCTQIRPFGPEAIAAAAALIRAGEPVAVPTETVYGLAALASHPTATRALFERKGRAADVPVAVL